MDWQDRDRTIRAAARKAVQELRLRHRGLIPWSEIDRGFSVGGETVRFATKAQGIFRPAQMTEGVLSIKSVVPRSGRRRWYEDQSGNLRFDPTTSLVRYSLERGGLKKRMNRALWRMMERREPLIYFVGRQPGVYEALASVRVEMIAHGNAFLSVDMPFLPEIAELRAEERVRSYSEQVVRKRNHQAWFSAATKAAYGYRCALSGLPVPELLVGAHIKADAEGGPASVRNGICMSSLHHGAFDSHLIGIDPDYRIHIARPLLDRADGPVLEALQELDRERLRLPTFREDRPDRTLLEERFADFRAAAS